MKLDNRVKEKVLKIMELALIKNGKNKNTVFVEFSGHVEWLRVSIYKNGWKESKVEYFAKDLAFWFENISEELEKVIKKLEELD